MTLTPRQMFAYLEFGDRLDRFDRVNALVTATLGAQGDQKAREKHIKELISGGLASQ